MLKASNIAKSFGGTIALSDASLWVKSGEVHGLLGANGAGKSTLSRIISGHIRPCTGDLTYKKKPFAVNSTRDAFDAGIVMVAQETSLAPDMTVLENIFLPELGKSGSLSFSALRNRAEKILARLGQENRLPLNTEVRHLSAAGRQMVEIAKALALDASLLIFDEPTSALSPSEVDLLFDIMSGLRDDGCGMIFVSHRLEECLDITDRITVLREGKTVAKDLETSGLTQADIVRHMVGHDLDGFTAPQTRQVKSLNASPVLSVRHLASGTQVKDVCFDVRPGEILGLGGLVGAGRSESCEAVFGLRKRNAGSVKVDGKNVHARSPKQGVAAGIGLVAEDRRAQSIVPDLSVRENMLLAFLGKDKSFGLGYHRVKKNMDMLLDTLGIPPNRQDDSLLNFSGGMQQKAIIARWLMISPKILFLDEPTKGVDVGTRASIYKLLKETAKQGMALVVISSDFEELLLLCDRVVVVSDGVSIADLPAASLTKEKLTLLSAPRTSAEQNTLVLKRLCKNFNATAFWILTQDKRAICLDIVANENVPDTFLHPGHETRFEDTAIQHALESKEMTWVDDPGSGLSTLIMEMKNKRGHDLGRIGLTLPRDAGRPEPLKVKQFITCLKEASS